MSFSFRKTVDKKYRERYDATAPIEEVDAMEFVISSRFLDEKPFPFQSLVIKVLYGLWEKYPITNGEQKVLNTLKENWGMDLNLAERDPETFVKILILVVGRRGTKTSLISFIQTYEAYKLICKGNPQKYYGIRERHPIQIVNCAKDGEQAKDPFTLAKDNIKRISFFRKYIDSTKDNESELRLFTPNDLLQNEKICKYNESRPKGSLKQNPLEGSILIRAFTTSAGGKRGKAVICIVFDEFAHFDRAKIVAGNMSDEDILNEMPQTDYAMYKAITPAVKDFKKDGKIIMISSPREKGGEFYKYYCLAGGKEQISPEEIVPHPKYLALQLSTWEANPNKPVEMFDDDFKADPIGCNMEYGAHFGDPSSTFIDSRQIDAMVSETKRFTTTGKYGFSYVICVDPATKGDTYAVGWAHVEEIQGDVRYHIDGCFGFRAILEMTDGRPRKKPINPAIVTAFINNLAGSIQRTGGKVLEICYDQWQSVDSIFYLQKLGYCAFETTFTNKYKEEIYGDFLEQLNLGRIMCFGSPQEDPPIAYQVEYNSGWVQQMQLELKYLEQTISGNTTYYSAPTSGPITTDDFADVAANMVHRLALRRSPDARKMKELYKQSGRPVKTRSGIKPTIGGSGFFPKDPMRNVRARVRRR